MNLAKGFHVYAIDALYHGLSSKEPKDTDDRQGHQVAAVVELMDVEGIPWAHVEEESIGAHITFRLGLEHPDRCGKLILNTGAQINFKRTFPPPLNPVENAMRLGLEALDSLSPDAIRSRLEWLMTTPDRVTDELVEVRLQLYSQPDVREAMRTSFTAALSTPPGGRRARYEEEDCAKLKPPALVFWTEFNPSNPPEVGEHLASLIPGSKHYLMKDAAHWPQWEHPEEHDRVISDFIQGRL